ncbi:MAG: hypothetical protein R3E32_07630 [Chitinophagales bacterium]
MRFILLSLLFIVTLFSSEIQAQKIDIKKQLKGMKMRSIGPAGMSGRVTSIDVDLNNPNTIFIGTASGGVWKSESNGIHWQPVFDDQPVQSIGAVAIDQTNTGVIWAGTGEGNPRNSLNSGNGIYKSLDGGKNWKHLGLENTKLIHRILIDPNNSDIVYVAALGSAWGENKERGVYKTTDGGKNWKQILYVDEKTGCADLVIDPSNPNKLVAAMWEYGRKPWTFNSGGKGSGLYITFDGGNTWKKRTDEDGLPKGDLGRIGLAIAPSNPKIIYALVEAKKNALYISEDGGFKWKEIGTKNIGNRPFYYADIFVDPKNENRIYSIHSVVTKSEDGGKSFETLIPYNDVHPDYHAFWVNPNNPQHLMVGNDGGMAISQDRGDNWRFVENLPLAQFYHINYDMDIPYNIYGGMQDNGSWVGPAYAWKSGGIRNSDWRELVFGDGFDVVPRPDNNRYGYAMYQGGNVYYYDRETGFDTYIQPNHPDGKELRFNWNAGIAQNPFHDCGVYFGSQFLHKSLDCGKTWEIISPDLTTNDTTKQQQAKSGGLTIDATRAENFTTIIAIAPSPVDEKVIWVGTDDGNLQLTKDGGKNWTNLASRLTELPKGSWIPQIEVSKKNAGEAFVVANDYRRNNWKPYVYHTTDYGSSWRRIVNENKVEGHAISIVQDPIEPKLLFLGTDYGLYVSIDGGAIWNKWMHDYPSVSTADLKIHPREHDLIIGTFGRAAYILDDIRPLRELAQNNANIFNKDFHVFEAPDAYMVSFRSVDGVRFGADAHYRGKNKSNGAMISFWANVKETKKEDKSEAEKSKNNKVKDKKAKSSTSKMDMADANPEKEEEDSLKTDKKRDDKKVYIAIFDENGDTVRNYSAKIDTGLNRIFWGFNENGVHFPSREDTKPDADPPSGGRVLPGSYKVILSWKDYKDSTSVNVKLDPRGTTTLEQVTAQKAAEKDFIPWIEKATKGFNQLKQAEKTMNMVAKQLKFAEVVDTLQKNIGKKAKVVKDSISNMMKVYMLPTDLKGIHGATPTLQNELYRALSFIGNANGAPQSNALYAVDKTKKEITAIIERINAFFGESGLWKEYQAEVDKVEYSLFKKVEEIELE